jgi:hypothetical protein
MNDDISKPLPSDLLREWTRLREPGSPLSAAQPLQCALALSNVVDEIDDYLQNDFIVNEMDNAVIKLSQMMAADDVHRNVTSCDDNTRASTFGFSDDDLNSLTHCMSSEMLFDSLLIRRGDLECDDDSANFGSLGFVVGLVNCTSATGDASCVPHCISSNIKVTATVAVQTETHLQQQPHVQSQAPVQAQLPTMVGKYFQILIISEGSFPAQRTANSKITLMSHTFTTSAVPVDKNAALILSRRVATYNLIDNIEARVGWLQ